MEVSAFSECFLLFYYIIFIIYIIIGHFHLNFWSKVKIFSWVSTIATSDHIAKVSKLVHPKSAGFFFLQYSNTQADKHTYTHTYTLHETYILRERERERERDRERDRDRGVQTDRD